MVWVSIHRHYVHGRWPSDRVTEWTSDRMVYFFCTAPKFFIFLLKKGFTNYLIRSMVWLYKEFLRLEKVSVVMFFVGVINTQWPRSTYCSGEQNLYLFIYTWFNVCDTICTVSIIGLEPTRPGYQAWVHTVVWFGQNCAPRPGRLKTNYWYCICTLSTHFLC